MFEKEKAEVIKNALRLDRYGLVALSGGNITWRMESGEILVTPSGMIYEDMVPEDVLVVDIDGNVIEGDRKPSVDTKAPVVEITSHKDNDSVAEKFTIRGTAYDNEKEKIITPKIAARKGTAALLFICN